MAEKGVRCSNCGALLGGARDVCGVCRMPIAEGALFAHDALSKAQSVGSKAQRVGGNVRPGHAAESVSARARDAGAANDAAKPGARARRILTMLLLLPVGIVAARWLSQLSESGSSSGDEVAAEVLRLLAKGAPQAEQGAEAQGAPQTEQGAQQQGAAGVNTSPSGVSAETSTGATGETGSEPSPEQAGALPSASFEFHNKRPAYGGAFYILGEVTNTSTIEIRKPELVITLLDAAGNEITKDSGFAIAESLLPGEKSYLSAIVTDPPAHAGLRYEVAAQEASYIPERVAGLVVVPNDVHLEWSMHVFSGNVENRGSVAARFVSVHVLTFDAQDKLSAVFMTYAKAEQLAPGAQAAFLVRGPGLDPPPTRIEYLVSGRPLD